MSSKGAFLLSAGTKGNDSFTMSSKGAFLLSAGTKGNDSFKSHYMYLFLIFVFWCFSYLQGR